MIVTYVDDIHVILSDPSYLRRVILILLEYSTDFCLELSRKKSSLWGGDEASVQEVSQEARIAWDPSMQALGAEWPTHKTANPLYAKEFKRIEEADRRLQRVRHMPIALAAKIDVIAVAALSMIDYINPPRMESVRGLRACVKKAFGQQFAAPEILYNCALKSSLDPCVRWLLSVMRLWHHVLQQKPTESHLRLLTSSHKARLGWGAEALKKQDILIVPEGFVLEGTLLPISRHWSECRARAIQLLKTREFVALARRRPNTFDGLMTCSERHHRKFLATLPAYEQGVVMKLWTGSVMTRAKNAVVSGADPLCDCGEVQNLYHLLWDCPLVSPPSSEIAHFRDLPTAQSVAHKLPKHVDSRDVKAWRLSCLRAVQIVSKREKKDCDGQSRVRACRDRRGHDVAAQVMGAIHTA